MARYRVRLAGTIAQQCTGRSEQSLTGGETPDRGCVLPPRDKDFASRILMFRDRRRVAKALDREVARSIRVARKLASKQSGWADAVLTYQKNRALSVSQRIVREQNTDYSSVPRLPELRKRLQAWRRMKPGYQSRVEFRRLGRLWAQAAEEEQQASLAAAVPETFDGYSRQDTCYKCMAITPQGMKEVLEWVGRPNTPARRQISVLREICMRCGMQPRS